jgi:ribosomal protein L14E/L6E/L27E
MDAKNQVKMKKIIYMLLITIAAFLIFQFLYFVGDDYIKANKCKESKYVACDDGVTVEFSGYKINEIENLRIYVIQKENFKKKIEYNKIDSLSLNDLSYNLKDKILKTDTLLIKLNKKEFKIYDFKNEGRRQKAGVDKGTYYCNISTLTINSKIDTLHATNRIVIHKI